MTELRFQLVTFVVLAIGAGGITVDLARGFLADYGWPWERKPGTNGRWRTDAMVLLLFGVMAMISVVSVVAIAASGWAGARTTTTGLVAVLAAASVGAWLSGKTERRTRHELGEEAAARTERAAAVALAAAEDTRRAAAKIDSAAEAVIERLDGDAG